MWNLKRKYEHIQLFSYWNIAMVLLSHGSSNLAGLGLGDDSFLGGAVHHGGGPKTLFVPSCDFVVHSYTSSSVSVIMAV